MDWSEFIEVIRNSIYSTIELWNSEKLIAFEGYFGSSFSDFLLQVSPSQKTQERTKLVSPAFTNELNKAIAQRAPGFLTVHEDGYDAIISIDQVEEKIEEKVTSQTTQPSERQHYWTGNHVSKKDGAHHLLIRLEFDESGEIIACYAGLLDYKSCTHTKWSGGEKANYSTLKIKWSDAEHLTHIIGNSLEEESKRKKNGEYKKGVLMKFRVDPIKE